MRMDENRWKNFGNKKILLFNSLFKLLVFNPFCITRGLSPTGWSDVHSAFKPSEHKLNYPSPMHRVIYYGLVKFSSNG